MASECPARLPTTSFLQIQDLLQASQASPKQWRAVGAIAVSVDTLYGILPSGKSTSFTVNEWEDRRFSVDGAEPLAAPPTVKHKKHNVPQRPRRWRKK